MKLLLIALTLSSGALFAQTRDPANANKDNRNQTYVNAKGTTLEHKQKVMNSRDLTDMEQAARQAENAIAYQDKDDALEHVNHALKNADQILDRGQGDYVPFYEEFTTYSVLGPFTNARLQGDLKKSAENKPQTKAEKKSAVSDEPSQANKQQPTTVQEATGEYSSIGVNVKEAKEHLMAAKQALNNGNLDKADAALKAVSSAAVISEIRADLPLVRARENLIIARRDAAHDNTAGMRAALKASSNALAEYRTSSSAKNRDEATRIRQEIQQFVDKGKAGNDATSKIDNWWDEVTDLTPRPTTTSNNG